MQFQEYQAKQLLAQYGIAVPRGEVAASANQAGNAAFRLGGRVAVKAQVLGEGPVTQVSVDPAAGPTQAQAQQLAGALDLQAEAAAALQQLLQNLCRAFRENECREIHLNPLAVTPQSRLVALNAYVVVDDGVLGRHANLVALRNS